MAITFEFLSKKPHDPEIVNLVNSLVLDLEHRGASSDGIDAIRNSIWHFEKDDVIVDKRVSLVMNTSVPRSIGAIAEFFNLSDSKRTVSDVEEGAEYAKKRLSECEFLGGAEPIGKRISEFLDELICACKSREDKDGIVNVTENPSAFRRYS